MVAKRSIAKKVTIRLELRDPVDPIELLQSVEDAFRLGIGDPELAAQDERAMASAPIDVSLEARAREHAARILDQWDAAARRAGSGAESAVPQQNTRGWLNRARAAGLRITVKLRDESGAIANIGESDSERLA